MFTLSHEIYFWYKKKKKGKGKWLSREEEVEEV